MSNNAICDQCNKKINKGSGYVFYSTANAGMTGMEMETGNMLLCEKCANEIVSEEGYKKYSKSIATKQKFEIDDIIGDKDKYWSFYNALGEANTESIVTLCKAHGFTPEEAKAKAHELALLWWEDNQKGALEAANFWKSSAKEIKHKETYNIVKIYELNSKREDFIISLSNDSSNGQITTLQDLEKTKNIVDELYKKRLMIFSLIPILGFIISLAISIFLLIILNQPIGGWRWPISIAAFIIIFILLFVYSDELKSNEELKEDTFSKRFPEASFYRILIKKCEKEKTILNEVMEFISFIKNKSNDQVDLSVINSPEFYGSNMSIAAKSLLQVINKKIFNQLTKMAEDECLYNLGLLTAKDKVISSYSGLSVATDSKIKLMDKVFKEYRGMISILCFEECIRKNLIPDKSKEIKEDIREYYVKLIKKEKSSLNESIKKELGKTKKEIIEFNNLKIKESKARDLAKQCLEMAEWISYSEPDRNLKNEGIEYCKITSIIDSKGTYSLLAKYIQKILESY